MKICTNNTVKYNKRKKVGNKNHKTKIFECGGKK